MTSKTMKRVDAGNMIYDGLAATLLDLIEVPEGETVAVLVLAYEGTHVMRAHFNPLTDAELSCSADWWDGADVHVDTYFGRHDEMAAEAKRRWPRARVFTTGCLCCSGASLVQEC